MRVGIIAFADDTEAIDALVVGAAVKRPMRFVMDHQIFRTPVLGFVFRTAKAIPIASKKEDPALDDRAGEAAGAGQLAEVASDGLGDIRLWVD